MFGIYVLSKSSVALESYVQTIYNRANIITISVWSELKFMFTLSSATHIYPINLQKTLRHFTRPVIDNSNAIFAEILNYSYIYLFFVCFTQNKNLLTF